VVTSSCAAIFGDNADLGRTPDGIFTEEIWNTSSTVDHQPYSYSKTLAEREAWEIHRRQDRWDLVTINPPLVMGPGLDSHGTSESFAIMKQYGDGTLQTGMPRWGMGIVDVRDVAVAHYRAGFTAAAQGRYIVSGHNADLADLVIPLRQRYGNTYPFPPRTLPKWLVWLVGPLTNKLMTRKVIRLNADLPWKGDNGKSVRELGMSYRPLEETVVEFFQQLVDGGAFDVRARQLEP